MHRESTGMIDRQELAARINAARKNDRHQIFSFNSDAVNSTLIPTCASAEKAT